MSTHKRLSNFEWLRVFSMFLIVLSHLATHGPFDVGYHLGKNGALLEIISGLGNLGVILFIYVSTYFLVDRPISRRQSIQKFIHLGGLMIFYNLVLWFFARLWQGEWLPYRPFSPFGNAYWFMSYYLIFLLISPILSWGMDQLDLKWRQYLLIVASVLLVGGLTTRMVDFSVHSQRWLLFAYAFLLMSVFKHSPPKLFGSQKAGWVWIGVGLGVIGIHLLLSYFKFTPWTQAYDLFLYFSPAMVTLALGIFTVCRFTPMAYSPKVNWMAARTLGIYLIHEHWAIRGIIWESLDSYHLIYWWQTLGFGLFFVGSLFGLCLIGASFLDKLYESLYTYIYERVTVYDRFL